MARTPKVVQLIATSHAHVVTGETPNGMRIVEPVLALALLEDGSIRPVFVETLKNDNVGRLKLASADALISFIPPD